MDLTPLSADISNTQCAGNRARNFHAADIRKDERQKLKKVYNKLKRSTRKMFGLFANTIKLSYKLINKLELCLISIQNTISLITNVNF